MPKISTHHIYGSYCHKGGDRSGRRLPHRFHASVAAAAPAVIEATQAYEAKSDKVVDDKDKTNYDKN